jgi:hypothetical protein
MLDDISAALRRYWYWTTSGSMWRLAGGIGGPILAVALFYYVVFGGGGGDDGGSARAPTPSPVPSNVAVGVLVTPRTTVVATGSPQRSPSSIAAATSATAAATTRPAGTPGATGTAVAGSGLTYVVKSGDTLGAICAARVPNMDINACIAAIVSLNRLSGPDQLALDQQLALPAGASTSAGGTPAAGTPSGSTATRPAGTPTTPTASNNGVSIVSLTTPVLRNQNATLRAVVPPNASCTLTFRTPSGTASDAAGLGTKSADAQGTVNWTWLIAQSTTVGNGSVQVTCNGVTATSAIAIQ